MRTKSINNSIIIVLILAVLLAITGVQVNAATSARNASGYVNSPEGLNLREHATKLSKSTKVLKDNTKVTIIREVYTSKKNPSANKKWYYVKVAGTKGYVMAKYVDGVKYKTLKGKTSSVLNVRTGPGVEMNVVGTIGNKKTVTVYADAKIKGDSMMWYKVKVDGQMRYISAQYVKLQDPAPVKKPAAKAPAKKPAKTPAKEPAKTPAKTPAKEPAKEPAKTPAKQPTTTKPSTPGPDSPVPPETEEPEQDEPILDSDQQKRAKAFLKDLDKLGDELISKGFKYKCGGASNNYADALKKKNYKVDCAVYVSWSMQRCGYLSTNKKIWLNNKVNGSGKNEVKSNPKLTVMYPNKKFKNLDLLPGDIIGYKLSGGQHTMVYAGKNSSGKSTFYSGGGSDISKKNMGPVVKNIDDKKIGVVIRIK